MECSCLGLADTTDALMPSAYRIESFMAILREYKSYLKTSRADDDKGLVRALPSLLSSKRCFRNVFQGCFEHISKNEFVRVMQGMKERVL
jgi:hypothetical protein